jgi:hypothetical protein
VCAETSTVLRAVAADFSFNCWYLEIPSDNRIWHMTRCVHLLNYKNNARNNKTLASYLNSNMKENLLKGIINNLFSSY